MKFKNYLLLISFLVHSIIFPTPIGIDYLSNGRKNIILISDIHNDDALFGMIYTKGKFALVEHIPSLLGCNIEYNYDIDQKKMFEVLKKKKASILDNKYIITQSEEVLLNKLIELDRANISADIIWEANNEELNLNSFVTGNFISFGLNYLIKNIHNIKIIAADNYRRIKFDNKGDFGYFVESYYKQLSAPKFLKLKIDDKKKIELYRSFIIFFQKLIKEIIPQKTQNLDIDLMWIYEDLNNFYLKFIQPLENLDDKNLLKNINILEKDSEFINGMGKDVFSGVADAEMLHATLNSKNKTSILYIGGAHSKYIKYKLMKKTDFKLIFSKDYLNFSMLMLFKSLGKYIYYRLMYKMKKDPIYATYNIMGLMFKEVEPEDFDIIDLANR